MKLGPKICLGNLPFIALPRSRSQVIDFPYISVAFGCAAGLTSKLRERDNAA
jgi:hypothetical protein